MAAGPNDLTTLANVKAYLGVTASTYDTVLQTLLSGVSMKIQTICGRQFNDATYTERSNTSTKQLRAQVKNKPIIQVNTVRWGYANCLYVSYTGSAILAIMNATPTGVILRTQASGAAPVDTTLLFATYPTTASLGAAISALSGFAATVFVDIPCSYIYPATGLNIKAAANQTVRSLAYPNVDVFDYTVDYDRGVIAFQPLSSMDYFFTPDGRSATQVSFPQGFQSLMIEYVGGYVTIPADLDLLAQELTADAFNMSKRDGNLTSEQLGDYNYAMLDPIMRTNKVLAALAPYMKIPMAGGTG